MPFTPGRAFTAAERANAAATRAARGAGLRRDFADRPEWERLASAYGVRQPAWSEPVTVSAIRRWCKRLGISTEVYREWWSSASLGEFARQNPDWPLRAWLGLLLEGVAQGALVRRLAAA